MANNPVDSSPTTLFSTTLSEEKRSIEKAQTEEPVIQNPNSFKLALFSQGKPLGWLGENGKEWAILVTDPNQALVLEVYPHNGSTYYRIKGTSRYMSVSLTSYIGFYNWLNASGFTTQGTHLVSDYNGQKLSLYSQENGYLYAWDDYTVLDVQFEPVEKPVIPDPPLTAQIEHVVVVMLENRSFDNVLGGLYPDKSKSGEFRGLCGDESNPLDPHDPSKGRVTVFQGPDDPATWITPYPDPGELFSDMNEQIFGTATPDAHTPATMQGFAWNYSKQPGAPLHKDGPDVKPVAKNIMQYYRESAVPMSYYLAKHHAVCDGWFAAAPVQTITNRMFAHCGTPGRLTENPNMSRVNNDDYIKEIKKHLPKFVPPVQDKTIFELLDETYPGERNWKVYYHDAPLSALCRYVYAHWDMDSWDGGNVFHFHELFGDETNFEYDIKNNRLPKYSFIEPRYSDMFGGVVNSSHPGGAGISLTDPDASLPPPISIHDGEQLLKQIYTILQKYPETFKKTLLVVIYDEHGGCYDHLSPPTAVSPFEPPVENFNYNRYGVRIPAILVNPAIPPGTIYRLPASPTNPDTTKPPTEFDHTSLISTVCAQFGLKGSLTARSNAAPTLKDLIPAQPQEYTRPAPPEIPGATLMAEEFAPSAVPTISIEDAFNNEEQLKKPNSLTRALIPLLSIAQQGDRNASE